MLSTFFVVNRPDDILVLGRVDCPSAFEQIAFVFVVFFCICLSRAWLIVRIPTFDIDIRGQRYDKTSFYSQFIISMFEGGSALKKKYKLVEEYRTAAIIQGPANASGMSEA
jgi:hypothetical protein